MVLRPIFRPLFRPIFRPIFAQPIPITQMDLISDLTLQRGIGPATFTRSTTGTEIDRLTGLVTTSTIGAARFETNGLLIEGSSSNVALHSRDLSNPIYVPTNIIAIKDAIGADGIASSASTVTATSNGGVIFQPVVKASAENTYSMDIRRKTGTGVIEITDDGGATFTDVTSSLNTVLYTRFQITNTQTNPSIGFRLGTSGDEIEVDYIGLETLPFASSRIETTTTSVTRAADNLSIDAANIPAVGSQYSIAMQLDRLGINTSRQRLYDVAGLVNKTARFVDGDDKTTVFDGTGSAVVTTSNSVTGFDKFVFTSDTLSVAAYLGGVKSDGVIINTPTGSEVGITLGSRTASEFLFGHIKNFKIFDVALTANQVANL